MATWHLRVDLHTHTSYSDGLDSPTQLVAKAAQQGLEALVRRPNSGILPRGWPEGGYLYKQEIPKDPWGNAYVYISPGQHSPDYDLKSFGADGVEGGDSYNADLESWRISR